MSSFAALIATIQANIKTNGNEEITGAVLQDVLEAMVDALGTEAINNLETDLAAEIQNRQNADTTLSNNIGANYASINAINGKMPSEASSSNKLTDKAYVDDADTALQTAINGIKSNIDNGFVYAGIATPSGTPASGKVFYLALTAGTYTNFGGLVVTQGINILKYNGTAWSQEQLIGIDDEPTAGSSNLVKSGGVKSEIDNTIYFITDSLDTKDTDITGGYDFIIDSASVSQNGTIESNIYGWKVRVYQFNKDKVINCKITKAYISVALMDSLPSLGSTGATVLIWQGEVGYEKDLFVKSGQYLLVNWNDTANYGQCILTDKEIIKPTDADSGVVNLLPNRFEEKVTGKNLYDKNSVEQGSFNENGIESSSDGQNYVTPYIPIKGGVNMCHTAQDNTGKYHVFYNVAGYIIGVQDATTGSFTTPEDAAYIRLTVKKSVSGSFQFEYGNSPTAYESYIEGMKDVSFDELSDVLCIDSFEKSHFVVKAKFNEQRISSDYYSEIDDAVIEVLNNTVTSNPYGWSVRNYKFDQDIIIKYKFLDAYGNVALSDEVPSGVGSTIGKVIANANGESGIEGTILLKAGKCLSVSINSGRYEIDVYKLSTISGYVEPEIVTITCSRDGVSGVDADFCGLNSVTDALNSIHDASPSKIYNIIVKGHFLFTNPKLTTDGGDFKALLENEPSAIVTKDYCNIIGADGEQAVFEIRLAEGLTDSDFPVIGGVQKTYTNYQVVYISSTSKLKNVTFIGQNLRYVIHVEQVGGNTSEDMEFDNCRFIRNAGTEGFGGIFTAGEIENSVIKIKNSQFVSYGDFNFIGGHTPLHNVGADERNCEVIVDNCTFIGKGSIGFQSYTYNRKDVMNMINCNLSKATVFAYRGVNSRKRELGNLFTYNTDVKAVPVNFYVHYATALRIKTIAGQGSSVRVNSGCSAFGIFSNGGGSTGVPTDWGATMIDGYEYKDDPYGSHAYACGWVNIDPDLGSSLGTILGDCSQTNKILAVTINGTDYNVVFNTDLTNASNSDVIAIINNVIGSVAVCDTYNPEYQEYPHFKEIEYNCISSDESVISEGMGVVIVGMDENNGSVLIRKAKNSDGHIDGIALDTIYKGQKGRMLIKGVMYNKQRSGMLFFHSITPVVTVSAGETLAIDPNDDGRFVKSSQNPVLRAVSADIVSII